jgi:hypothetical protein
MKVLHRFASGPLIARLLMRHRMSVNEAMRIGTYGPTFFRGRIRYADLAAVEAFYGFRFTDNQIERASEGKPERVLRVSYPDTKETTDGHAQAQG